ncbi:MAG: helix-hairpin-helix domain-containing protein [Planctomycetia bacterium]|nr:helix-hairpin-helix domain-containing protein [Planctomycetia bacterium]
MQLRIVAAHDVSCMSDSSINRLATSASTPAPTDVQASWPRSAQLTTAFLLGVSVTLLAMQFVGSTRWGARPAELEPRGGFLYRIDVNRASQAELMQVPGLGPVLAERIEEHRRGRGPFQRVEQLTEVPGIGPATLERIRPWLCVLEGEPGEPSAVVRRSFYPPADEDSEDMPRPPAGKKEPPASPIDVNRAGAAELQKLPSIGPVLSLRIIDERGKRPFRSVEDLRRVPGIGPKTLDKLKPYVTVGARPATTSGL